MKLSAAYKTGKLLSQLNWHLTQAGLGVRQHESLFDEVYSQLICDARGVVELPRNQDRLQEKIKDAWRGLNVALLHSNTWNCRLKELQSKINVELRRCQNPFLEVGTARQIRIDVCTEFLNPAIAFINDVRRMIEIAVQKELTVQGIPDAVDRMSRSLRFGEFVSQSMYPRDIARHMFRPWSWDEWGRNLASQEAKDPKDGADLEGSSRIEFVELPFVPSGFGRISQPPELECVGTSIEPGELPVPEIWFAELRRRWGELQFGTLPAEIEHFVAIDPSSERSSVRRLPKNTIAALVESIDGAFQSHADAVTDDKPHGVTAADVIAGNAGTPPSTEQSEVGGGSKRAGGRRPLEESDPKKFRVYDRIQKERMSGKTPANILAELKKDSIFTALVQDAGLKLTKDLIKQALSYFYTRNKRQTPQS